MTWRSLVSNAGWKLASLVIAVLLWAAILGAPDVVTMQAVPIFFKAVPPELLVNTNGVERVSVEVGGPSSKVTPGNLAGTAVVLPLNDVSGPGDRTFTLSDANIELPDGVRLIRAVPSQLRLTFDRLLTKQVPVVVQFANSPPPGYRVSTEDVMPPALTIAGPESQVASIQNVPTDAVDISGITASASFQVNTYVPISRVRFTSPSMVTVKITVEKTGN